MAKRKTKITEKIVDRDHITPKYVDDGIAIVSPQDFTPNEKIDFDHCVKISLQDHLRVMKSEISPENLSKTTNDPPVTAPVKKPGRFDDLIDLL